MKTSTLVIRQILEWYGWCESYLSYLPGVLRTLVLLFLSSVEMSVVEMVGGVEAIQRLYLTCSFVELPTSLLIDTDFVALPWKTLLFLLSDS